MAAKFGISTVLSAMALFGTAECASSGGFLSPDHDFVTHEHAEEDAHTVAVSVWKKAFPGKWSGGHRLHGRSPIWELPSSLFDLEAVRGTLVGNNEGRNISVRGYFLDTSPLQIFGGGIQQGLFVSDQTMDRFEGDPEPEQLRYMGQVARVGDKKWAPSGFGILGFPSFAQRRGLWKEGKFLIGTLSDETAGSEDIKVDERLPEK